MPYYIQGSPPVGLPWHGLGFIPLVVSAAAGGYAVYKVYTDEEIEDLWRDAATFNDKARRINAVWEGVNAALSRCPAAWNDATLRVPFREAWLRGWAPWYADTGDRYFDASVSDVQQLRDYLVAVNSWSIKIGEALRRECPDEFKVYPYKALNAIGLNPTSGTITEQQKARLEEARRTAEIDKLHGEGSEAAGWGALLKGVGWLLVGGAALTTVAIGYRVYSDTRKKR